MDDEPRLEPAQVSRVKVVRNAKGDPQWEVVVVPDTPDEVLSAMRVQAVNQYQALVRELLPS